MRWVLPLELACVDPVSKVVAPAKQSNLRQAPSVDSLTQASWQGDDAAAMLQRIRGEFREMPGLKLTTTQAARLWQLDQASSRVFLDALVVDGMLRRKADGVYLVASDRP